MSTWFRRAAQLFQNHRVLIRELHHQVKPATYSLDMTAQRRK